ncbi:MAG TPA: ATP synthase F1 subunit delta [Phycisphaerales bacterium]|nr:ATP synthase F1 subunit delta [Phycisphaerales bacterium]
MPLPQIASNATTRVYAKSLFEMVMAKGGQQKIAEIGDELEQIVEMANAQPALGELFANPSITTAARNQSLDKIFKGRISHETLQFLHVLNEKGRIGALTGIVDSLQEIVQEQFGVIEVDVYTAQPATPDMVSDITNRLARALGKQVVVHTYTQPEMIGGVKIQIGDQLLDGSVATQLRKLTDKLNTDGSSAMRAKMGRILDA